MAGDIESRMEFIIEQQAQFTADMQALAAEMQALKERQDQAQLQIEANAGMIRQLGDVTMSLAHHADETDQRLGEADQRWDARMKQLAESGAHTDRRLDALIDTVDKLVRRNCGAA